MKLKTIEVGGVTYALIENGNPVYTHDDGRDVAFDAPATVTTINRITEESKGFKTRAQSAETKLAAFDGIDDPEAAKKALSTVANLDDKKLVEAGEVEKVKAAAIASVRAEFEPIVAERDTLKGQLDKEIKGGSFARSKYAEEKVAVPRHMLEKTYGDSFKVIDGKLVPHDAKGDVIRSRVRHGEVADFDEALEILISADPFKDHILKGSNAQGSGAQNGGGGGGDKTLTRTQFDAMPQHERAAKVKDGFKVVDAA